MGVRIQIPFVVAGLIGFVGLSARADDVVNHESIRAAIIGHLGEVRVCFDTFRKEHPGIEGQIFVDFTIGDNGRVRRAVVNAGKSSVKDEALHTCMLAALRAWKFPEPHAGEEADVSYPFDLAK